jgi:hypothetical protein
MRPQYPQVLLKSENSGENEASFSGAAKFAKINLLQGEYKLAEKCICRRKCVTRTDARPNCGDQRHFLLIAATNNS